MNASIASTLASPRRRRRGFVGFTLMEVAVSMMISLATVYAACHVLVLFNKMLIVSNKEMKVDVTAKNVTDNVVTALQGVGGYDVRPWMAAAVEQAGCPVRGALPLCGAHDRLTFVHNDDTRHTVIVTGVTAGSPVKLAADANCGTDADECCFRHPLGVDADPPVEWAESAIILFNDTGTDYAPYTVVGQSDSPCELHVEVGQDQLPMLFNPAVVALPPSGYVQPVKIWVFFRDTTMGPWSTLVALNDVHVNTAFAPPMNSLNPVAPFVYDAQFALGYDVDGDGNVDEDGSASDEWLGNHPSDTMASVGGTGATDQDLRMVMFGTITGEKAAGTGDSTAQVLDGAPVTATDVILRATVGRAMLRNSNVFY